MEIFPDVADLMRAAAEHVARAAGRALADCGRFDIALAGGETPRGLYEHLASPPFRSRIDWPGVHVFFGDERCVPPEDPESNYRMARETLLSRVPIPDENVHRIQGEDDPFRAADEYESLLRAVFASADGPPVRGFDLVLLGMGTDGHTASLFPGTPALREARRWVVANHVEQPREMWRVTLTPVVLNAAADVTFLVAGPGKAAALRAVLEGPADSAPPARLIQPRLGALHWMVDAAAAAGLRESRR